METQTEAWEDLDQREFNMFTELPKLIGIGGYARVGKDTVGKSILTYAAVVLNKPYKRVAFADELKKEIDPFVKENFGFSVFSANDEQKKIIRPLLVGLGESRRIQNPEYWIYKAKLQVEINKNNGIGSIVTDVRYKNEAQWIKDNGGIVIYIHRNGIFAPNPTEEESIPEVQNIADYILGMSNFRKGNYSEKVYKQIASFIKENF